MVNLHTERTLIYCKIIHNYLECEIFGDPEIDVGDMVEIYMPKYLFREQYQKCIDTFRDLFEWTKDPFWHEMTAFHEVALFYFLKEMSLVKDDMKKDFKKVYYDADLKKEIHECAIQEKKEFRDEFTVKELEEWYYDPDDMCDSIFEDIDFVELPILYNEQKANMPTISKLLGINLDYYFEILPIDIQKQYKSNHVTLLGEVSELFNYLQQRINRGSLAELFWENGKPINEKKIHVIIENIMHAYFMGKRSRHFKGGTYKKRKD